MDNDNNNNLPDNLPPTDNGGKPISKDGTPQPEPQKHGMSDSEAKLLKEAMEKKAQLKEQGEKIAELEKTMSALKELGGLDTFKQMLDAQKALETKKAEEKGEWEKLKAQMAEEHAKATEGYKSEIETLKQKLTAESKKISELTVGAAFSNSKYLSEKTILTPNKARIIYGDYFDIAEDGSIKAYDKPRGASDRTELVDQMGNGLGFEDAIEKIVVADPEHESILRAIGGKGSGSGTDNAKAQSEPQKQKLTPLEMIAQGLSTLK